jgi:Bifunctional DNA primase/polymerase, N-terminal
VAKLGSTCNVGIAPNASRLVFMDVDTKIGKRGQETFDALIAKHGPLPPTLTVRTPSGGLHYWFNETFVVQHRFGVNAFGPDVDCPQYVLTPGSVFIDDGKFIGRYTVIDKSPIADAPDWFADYLQERVESPGVGDNEAPAVDLDEPENIKRAIFFLQNDAKPSIEGSGGEKAMLDVAAMLKDLGISEREAVALIGEHYNVDGKCVPIWPPDELTKKISNAYEYLKENQPGALGIGPDADFAADAADDVAEAIAFEKMKDWCKLFDQMQREAKYDHRDFLLYLPGADKTKFIFTATGSEEFWSATAVNLKCKPQPIIDERKKGKTADECEKIDGTRDQFMRKMDEQGKVVLGKDGKTIIAYQSAANWIMNTPEQHIAAVTWWPGKPSVIRNTIVIKEGGIIPKKGMHSFNRYRPARLSINTPCDAKPWLDHLKLIYPDDWQHILCWLASRVQRPEQKIMHALVFGGASRIGKDMLLKPIPFAIGPWNFASTNAQTIMDEPKFTPYLESVICLIHEAKDFGDQDRYAFYHRIKPWIGGEARGVLMSADKNVKVHAIIDVWAPIITTNFKLRGLYIPPDDARIYFAWSKRTRADWLDDMKIPDHKLDADYFKPLQNWYESGGYEAVAHYLRTFDLAKADFSPTAPPPKTDAWHEVVAAGRDHKENVLGRIIDDMGNPAALTINEVRAQDADGELDWWSAKGRNQVAPQMETAGYVRVLNDNKTGRWTVGPNNRRVEIFIYGQAKLPVSERRKAALEVFEREAVKAKKAPAPSEAVT